MEQVTLREVEAAERMGDALERIAESAGSIPNTVEVQEVLEAIDELEGDLDRVVEKASHLPTPEWLWQLLEAVQEIDETFEKLMASKDDIAAKAAQ